MQSQERKMIENVTKVTEEALTVETGSMNRSSMLNIQISKINQVYDGVIVEERIEESNEESKVDSKDAVTNEEDG